MRWQALKLPVRLGVQKSEKSRVGREAIAPLKVSHI